MQTGDNRYRLVRTADGSIVEHPNDRLCRRVGGVPDYTDPDLFPVLWDETRLAEPGSTWSGQPAGRTGRPAAD
jgi:hypothetical protein